MIGLKDAPWIREAEINGMPEGCSVLCPVCGSEADTFYNGPDGEIFACDRCLKSVDAYDYADRHGWFEPDDE